MIYTLHLGEKQQDLVVLVIRSAYVTCKIYHAHELWINGFRFSVAWYPIYRIPEGEFHAAFLTYHSFNQLIVRSIPIDSLSKTFQMIVFPVMGLQSYRTKVTSI
jgi:hypothetical protein